MRERNEAPQEQRRLRAITLLDKRVSWLEKLGGKVAGSFYREGKPDEEVLRLIEELNVGLVITGGRKLAWFQRIFADNLSEKLLRRVNCPVMVVREPVKRKKTARNRQQ